MKSIQLRTIVEDVQLEFSGNCFAVIALARIAQVLDEYGDQMHPRDTVSYLSEESAEALRQAEYYETHLRFYDEAIAQSRRVEAKVFETVMAALPA